jgi:hypothetical protein
VSVLELTQPQAWTLYLGIVLCPIVIYSAKALKLLSPRQADIVIGAYAVAVALAFLALVTYLMYSAGLIPNIPKSSRGKPNMDSADDIVFRIVAVGIWLWISGALLLAGIQSILGRSLFGKSKMSKDESLNWTRALKTDTKAPEPPSKQPVPWWFSVGVICLLLYACVQGFAKQS